MSFSKKFLLKSLLIFVVAWVVLLIINYVYQLNEYKVAREEAKKYNLNIINEAKNITSENLISTARNVIDIYESLKTLDSKEERMQIALDNVWVTLRRQNSNHKIEYYNAQGELVFNRFEQWTVVDNQAVIMQLSEALMAKAINSPQEIVEMSCENVCEVYLIKPVLRFSADEGFVKISLPIEHFLYNFYQLTKVNVIALVEKKNDIGVLGDLDIDDKQYIVEYASSYSVMETVSEFLTRSEKQEFISQADDGRYYEMRILRPDEIGFTENMVLVLYQDVTGSYEIFLNAIKRYSIASFVIIVLALMILYPLLFSLSKRLNDLMQTLPLIGEKKFNVVRNKLMEYKSKPKHELNNVLTSAYDLNDKLEDLYANLDKTNSKLQRALEQARNRHEFIASILNTAPSLIATCDENKQITSVNDFTVAMVGKNKKEIVGKNLSEIVVWNENDGHRFNDFIKKKENRNFQIRGMLNALDSDKEVIVLFYCNYMEAMDKFLLVGVDITENIQREKEMKFIAEIDEITGLYNRRKFMREVAQLLEKEQSNSREKIAIMFIDVDRFKIINDRWGHHIGNLLLKELASIFLEVLDGKGVVARFGGDEFMIALEGRTVGELVDIARDIEAIVAKHEFVFARTVIKTTLSVGVSLYPDHSLNLNKLISCADIAMYENKLNRLGGVAVYDGNESLTNQNHLEDEWNKKIKNVIDRELLDCKFQPVIDVKNNDVAHCEVLARITDDAKSDINDFFYYCEKSQLVPYIDRLVIKKGLTKISGYVESEIKYMFNISLLTLLEADFPEFFIQEVEKNNIDPGRIVLEITESRQVDYFHKLVKIIDSLKKHGVSFALDDYGEGYTSLMYLTKLPISYLKLDISLVSDIDENDISREIVMSITALCKKLDIKVIAEGVERQAQIDVLKEFEVDFLQGFYFYRPLTDEEFIQQCLL